jgi:hypothetical protein
MGLKNSEDWKNIYVLAFKTMNIKEFKPKIHSIKF